MPIVIGRSALNSASEGFARGSEGLAAGLRYRDQAKREDERYKQQVALAQQKLELDKAQEARAQEEHALRMRTQDEVRQGEKALTDYRLGQITPGQTEAGYVNQGGLQAAGGGILAPSRFAAGLMAHHERVLSHAKEVASKLPPELHERFFADVQGGLQRDQQQAMLAKAQSDIENLGKDLATPEAGGPVQDMLPAVQERTKAFSDLLQQAQDPNLPPEKRAQILSTVQQGIHAQRADLIQTSVRRKRMAAITGALQQQNDQARIIASDPSLPPEISATLHARIDERQALLEMANLDPDVTTDDLMRGWHSAGTSTVPRGRTTDGKDTTLADDMKLRAQFADEWHRMHPAKKDPQTGHEIAPGAPLDRGWLEMQVKQYREAHGGATTDSLPDMNLTRYGEYSGPKEQAAPAPSAQTEQTPQAAPIKFTEVKAPDRARFVAALRAAILRGDHQGAQAIMQQSGIDMDSIPQAVRDQILGATNAEKKKGRDKEREREVDAMYGNSDMPR